MKVRRGGRAAQLMFLWESTSDQYSDSPRHIHTRTGDGRIVCISDCKQVYVCLSEEGPGQDTPKETTKKA